MAFHGIYDEDNANGTALAAAGTTNTFDDGPSLAFDCMVPSVPEPASFALFGLSGLVMICRRR
ncbi:PEP-CTERM sorting domain-containing protein [Poriferisphaera corsica]|uniref:PEP-CTERM sorting domain-containing protein n=1 Tax=Poriferisphaera corsica TaxID=2528020 RepID=UPI0011AB29F7|nr:PEP-CTERM sorting domain-containing protein [Poriferisphaera corsica]